MIRALTLVGLLSTLLVASPASGTQPVDAQVWEGHLDVTDGSTRTRISFGMRPEGSDAFDRLHDVRLLMGGGIRAFFEHRSWPGGPYFARDIRGPGFPATWSFTVDRVRPGRTVTLRPYLQYVPYGCERVDLVLVDELTGARIDLRAHDAYRYVAAGHAARSFRIEAVLHRSTGPAAPIARWAKVSGHSGQAVIHWSPPQDPGVAAYHVYRRDGAGTVTRVSELPVHRTTFQDRPLPESVDGLEYLVRALNHDQCPGRPSAPMPLRLTGGGTARK